MANNDVEYVACAHIDMVEAVNLAIKDDDTQSSDPYVVVKIGQEKAKTRVIRRNLNPVWKERLTILVDRSATKIEFVLKDKDYFSTDDDLGVCELDLKSFKFGDNKDVWLDVKEGTGKLHVIIDYEKVHSEENDPAPDKDESNYESVVKSEVASESTKEAKAKVRVKAAGQFQANRPWAGAIVAPSKFTEPEPLAHGLALHFAFGYRTREVRDNLFYGPVSSQVIYPAAGLGVVYDKSTHTQRFFRAHTDDVLSLTMHPTGDLCATGEIGKNPKIFIWAVAEPEKEPKATMSIPDGRGVIAMSFSPDGELLVAVANDDEHTVYIWEWEKSNKPIASAKTSKDSIFDISFNPMARADFVTVGVKHIKFWTFENGKPLTGKSGVFGSKGSIQTMMGVNFTYRGYVVTGTLHGDVYLWKANQLVHAYAGAHNGPVYAIVCHANGFLTSGKDGRVIFWNDRNEKASEFKIEESIRNIDYSPGDGGAPGTVIIGTEDNNIYEADAAGKNVRLLLSAHNANKMAELWGLDVHPSNANVFITAGDDGLIKEWSISERKMLKSCKLHDKLRSIAYSPDATLIVVGSENGTHYVLKASDFSVVKKEKKRKEWISDIKFAPNGKYYALGSHDNFVDIYSTKEHTLHAICKGHSSFITHLDFSADSEHLQTNSGDYELLFWNVSDGKQLTRASALKDTEWATQSCILGWPVQGIWEPGMKGDDINAVDRNAKKTLLALGDDFSTVRLLSYPAYKEKAKYKAYSGHSSHVANVKFTKDGAYLVSAGGMDATILLWKVVKA